jgi:hypothetical protein
MEKRVMMAAGYLLLAFGILLLLMEYDLFRRIEFSWSLLFLTVGGACLTAYFTAKRQTRYLWTGCLTLSLGLYMFVLQNFLNYNDFFGKYWPGILIAIGLALLAMGIIRPDERKNIGSGIVLLTAAVGLQYIILNDIDYVGANTFIGFAGFLLLIIGIKLVADFALRTGKAS